jgi:hypothetical protein
MPFIDFELDKLPRLALVALAGRAVRRVRPLMPEARTKAADEVTKTIDTSIKFVCDVAAGIRPVELQLGKDLMNVEAQFEAFKHKRWQNADKSLAAVDTFVSAFDAAFYAAIHTIHKPEAVGSVDLVRSALRTTLELPRLSGIPSPPIWDVTARDFELLLVASELEKWTDETPVPQEFFGPLWPDGEPPGWPVTEEGSENDQLVLQVEVPDDASDDEVIGKVKELVDQADSLQRAYGGHGLKIDSLEAYGEALVPVEVTQ